MEGAAQTAIASPSRSHALRGARFAGVCVAGGDPWDSLAFAPLGQPLSQAQGDIPSHHSATFLWEKTAQVTNWVGVTLHAGLHPPSSLITFFTAVKQTQVTTSIPLTMLNVHVSILNYIYDGMQPSPLPTSKRFYHPGRKL